METPTDIINIYAWLSRDPGRLFPAWLTRAAVMAILRQLSNPYILLNLLIEHDLINV